MHLIYWPIPDLITILLVLVTQAETMSMENGITKDLVEKSYLRVRYVIELSSCFKYALQIVFYIHKLLKYLLGCANNFRDSEYVDLIYKHIFGNILSPTMPINYPCGVMNPMRTIYCVLMNCVHVAEELWCRIFS